MQNTVNRSEAEITKAQKWLQNLGSKVKVTGKWSIGMQTAVYCFQRRYELEQTGELDKATWKKLKSENSWWKKTIRKICGHKNKQP